MAEVFGVLQKFLFLWRIGVRKVCGDIEIIKTILRIGRDFAKLSKSMQKAL